MHARLTFEQKQRNKHTHVQLFKIVQFIVTLTEMIWYLYEKTLFLLVQVAPGVKKEPDPVPPILSFTKLVRSYPNNKKNIQSTCKYGCMEIQTFDKHNNRTCTTKFSSHCLVVSYLCKYCCIVLCAYCTYARLTTFIALTHSFKHGP